MAAFTRKQAPRQRPTALWRQARLGTRASPRAGRTGARVWQRALACGRPRGIVDALRAFHALPGAREDSVERDRIIALLQLAWKEPAAQPPLTGPARSARPVPDRPPSAAATAPSPPPTAPPPPVPEAPAPRPEPTEVELLEPVGYVPTVSPEELFEAVEELATYDRAQHGARLPPPEPLLPAARQRALLSALGSTWRPGREIQVERLTGVLAAARPVSLLPRKAVRVLSWRIQLLLDLSEGLLPYRRDQEELVASFGRVAGREALEVLYFNGCPLRGFVMRRGRPWHRYDYPLAGTPVVVVTDFGHGPAPGASFRRRDAEWLEFALNCRKRACPIAVLNPYARHRWPQGLERTLDILPWDLRLSVGEALRPVMALRRQNQGSLS